MIFHIIEIAGGILLAIFLLILILANLSRVFFLLYILLLIGLAYAGWLAFMYLPSGVRSVILFIAVAIASMTAFSIWSFEDKRFVLPEGQDGVHLSNRTIVVTLIILFTAFLGIIWIFMSSK